MFYNITIFVNSNKSRDVGLYLAPFRPSQFHTILIFSNLIEYIY